MLIPVVRPVCIIFNITRICLCADINTLACNVGCKDRKLYLVSLEVVLSDGDSCLSLCLVVVTVSRCVVIIAYAEGGSGRIDAYLLLVMSYLIR